MSSSAAELQKAVFSALSQDAALSTAMGGVRIHDQAPARVAFPYITFGRTSIYDWSTATEKGSEHLFTLHVWSKAKGRSEALNLIAIARQRLDDADLVLEGHHLVSLRAEFEEVRYNEDIAVQHGILRFRAVTEPAG